MLKIENAGVEYDKQKILDRISLEIGEQEIYVLMGPSGSGKTTLLRGIAGLTPFSEGKLSWKKKNGKTGLVFQEPRLFPHMTVMENLAFGLRARGFSLRARNQKVTQFLSILQLEGLEHRYPHQLSGGQKQRVSLGRVLVLEPDLLLLDEPFASLDAQLRIQLTDWLYQLQRNQGFSILWITHYIDEAFSVADRVGLLMNGRILQEGRPLDFYQTPISEKVASFFSLKNRFSREQWSKWLGKNVIPHHSFDRAWLPAEAIIFLRDTNKSEPFIPVTGHVKRVKHEPNVQTVLVDVSDDSLEVQIPLWEKALEVGERIILGIPVDKLIWYRLDE
jgi:ABC-type sulfate/molybdate transport systems ATPase subunit